MKAIFFVGQKHVVFVCMCVRVTFEESAFTLVLTRTHTHLLVVGAHRRTHKYLYTYKYYYSSGVREADGDSKGKIEKFIYSLSYSFAH